LDKSLGCCTIYSSLGNEIDNNYIFKDENYLSEFLCKDIDYIILCKNNPEEFLKNLKNNEYVNNLK